MIWIRSQDERELISTNWISYLPKDKKKGDRLAVAYISRDVLLDIGYFESKEAALEELYRIQVWVAAGAPGVFQVSGG